MFRIGLGDFAPRHRTGRTIGWRQKLRDLAADQSGATAVEFALLMPFLLTLLTGVIDVGFLFAVKNKMTSVSQDTARLVAIGNLTTTQAKTYASGKLTSGTLPYTVTVNSTGSDVVVSVAVPYTKVALVDFLGIFKSGNLTAQSSMRVV